MATTEPDPPTEPGPAAEPGAAWDRLRIRRWVAPVAAVLLVIVVVLLGLDAVRSARRMVAEIKDARNSLDDGAEAVVVGDPDSAVPQLHAAIDTAEAAVSASERPAMRVLSLLPVLGPNIRAARAVATAEADSARAGLTMADAARLLGWNNILIPAAQRVGDVDLAKVQAATPKLDSVARQLHAALQALESTGGGHLIGSVSSGYHDALVDLQRRATLAEDLHDVVHLLPSLLGGEGARHYLVAVQSLGKPRATGGLITTEGVLSADGGALQLQGLIPASAAMAATNVSPDLPTDGPQMLGAARHDGLGSLDGVILTDPVGLQDMLWMAGPVSPSTLHSPVTMDSGVDVLEKRLFLGTDASKATEVQTSVVASILRGFLARRMSVEAFAIGLAEAISERHLAVWSTSADDARSLGDLGATGAFTTKAPSLAVIWSGTATNRAVAFVRRATVQLVKLNPEGVGSVRTRLTMTNHAPKGPPSLLLGLRQPVGTWGSNVTVYLPRTAANPSATTIPSSSTHVGENLATSTETGSLSAGPGQTSSMTVAYRQRKAAVQENGVWRYQLLIEPQPALAPLPVHVSITLPAGATLVSKMNQLVSGKGSFTYDGAPQAPVTLWIAYRV